MKTGGALAKSSFRAIRPTSCGVAAIAWANEFTWEPGTRAPDTFLDEIRQSLV